MLLLAQELTMHGCVAAPPWQKHLRRVAGHDDVGGDAGQLRGQRERQRVVPRRVRDHAAAPLLLTQRLHRIARAAELERAPVNKFYLYETVSAFLSRSSLPAR